MVAVADIDEIVRYAVLCKLAYKNEMRPNLMRRLGLTSAQYIQTDGRAGGAQAWVFQLAKAADDCETVVAFRGTDSLDDILASVKIALVPYVATPCPHLSAGHVHLGYLQYSQALQRKLRDTRARDSAAITFLGHSLGGAVKFTALEHALAHGPESTRVVTFGSPPMGDKQFCRTFHQLVPRARRVTYEDDIVPRIPLPFHHHTHGSIVIPSLRRYTPKQVYKNHSIDTYVAGLRAMQRRLHMRLTSSAAPPSLSHLPPITTVQTRHKQCHGLIRRA